MPYTYTYPRPMVTVDLILIYDGDIQEILLIERGNEPFKGNWALPGGFVEMDEELKEAAIRELKEESGITLKDALQFHTYGTLNRDPRGRTISIVYYAFTNKKEEPVAASDAANAKWHKIENLPTLAFDHEKIISDFRLAHYPL